MSDGFSSSNSYPKRLAKPGRVDLIPKEFDNLIEDQGIRVRIIPAVLCPNRTSLHDTNHTLDCPICYGDEVIDLRDQCVEDWAYVQSIHLNKNMEVQGIWDVKDAQITVRAGVRLYYFYKIEIVDFSSVFNQIIKRGAGDTDRTRYNPAPNCDTPYYCVDKAGVRYELNTHYKIEDNKLRWLTPVRPAANTLYSLSYPVLPTFRVIEMLHENRYYYRAFKMAEKKPVQLPQQAVIRLDYLAKNSGSNIER
jgi:hypothetical protein